MNLIKVLNDAVDFIKKSDNIEITNNLINVQQEIINMEEQLYNLKIENRELKEKMNTKNEIERYRNIPIISLKKDNPKILYCANCYGSDNKLIQLQVQSNDRCFCKVCEDLFYIHNSPDSNIIIDKITNKY